MGRREEARNERNGCGKRVFGNHDQEHTMCLFFFCVVSVVRINQDSLRAVHPSFLVYLVQCFLNDL